MKRAIASAAVAALCFSPLAIADGTEALGAPSIPIAKAARVAAAGVGLNNGQPADIQLDLPLGAEVRQVLVYWEGLDWNATDHGDTAPITVGGVPVTGNRIGGPSDLFGSSWSSTFRADITGLNLVGQGMNTVSVGGVDFTRFQDGAGLVALYNLPGDTQEVQIADGNDMANDLLAAPFNTTEAVTFQFAPAAADRMVPVSLFFASFFPDRASVLVFSADGQQVDVLLDVIGHGDGASWTTVNHDVFVPAGASTLTIQALPVEVQQNPAVFLGTAKFVWLMASAAFEVPVVAKAGGLTPGFWKNHLECWDGKGADLTQSVVAHQSFNQTFGVTKQLSGLSDGVSLIEAAGMGGGGKTALARHAAAAIANADSNIGYPYSTAEVIALYQDGVGAIAGPKTVESAKDLLEAANELGYEFEGGKPCGKGKGEDDDKDDDKCDGKGKGKGKDDDKGKGKGKDDDKGKGKGKGKDDDKGKGKGKGKK